MSHPAIKVEGLCKDYLVGHARQRHGTFYDLLAHSLSAPLRRLRHVGGEHADVENFQALNDVSFEVQPGEVVGVIGRNGAGKSTLLKILSRITAPTKGRVTVRGRLASLLEVGTGFHPELSGRENIFLNGAILGMRRAEVLRKFDDIVAFAEVEKFIDTPVKRYSSGMYVRLAFSVAAHLETDVLLVDEVLAVGDAAFQRKCLGKMEDVAKGGKTVFLVSHNLAAVRSLCSSALLLEGGRLSYQGFVNEALDAYETTFTASGGGVKNAHMRGPLATLIQFTELKLLQNKIKVNIVNPDEDFSIELLWNSKKSFQLFEIRLGFYRDGVLISSVFDVKKSERIESGEYKSTVKVYGGAFRSGRYSLGLGASAGAGYWMWCDEILQIDFTENIYDDAPGRVVGMMNVAYSAERVAMV